MLHRGLKTLAVRVRHQNASALTIARFLQAHPAVEKVNYPGLEADPGHGLAKRFFDGFGGMLSFEINGDAQAADRFMQHLQLPIIAPSLGGVESLITRPATTSHAGLSPEQRHRLGISERLIRLSVGLEAEQDLIADVDQALAACH